MIAPPRSSQPREPARRYEPIGQATRWIGGFAIILFVSVLIIQAALWGLGLLYRQARPPVANDLSPVPAQQPPHNAPSSLDELVQLRERLTAEQQSRLNGSLTIESESGFRAIPIEQAMQMISERGLPDFRPPLQLQQPPKTASNLHGLEHPTQP